jgi:hypothetical protein
VSGEAEAAGSAGLAKLAARLGVAALRSRERADEPLFAS